MLRIVATGLLAIGVLGGTLMPAAAEQASDPCSSAKTIEIQPIGGWQVMTGASKEDGAPEDGALVLARASRNTVLMMACHAGKASYALFDSAMRVPSGQPVELDIRIDQRPVVRVIGKSTGKDGQIDLVAGAVLIDMLSNTKPFGLTLRSGRATKVYTFAMAQEPEALLAWCRLCGIER
jgi:hypothetical protein